MPQATAELIGSKVASEILGIDRSTLTRWVERGMVPTAGRLSGATGALLFERSAVEAYARRRSDQDAA